MTETTVFEPAFTLAFLAGMASFLSPCIFPLVPGYLSAMAAGRGTADVRVRGFFSLLPVIVFVLGFSFVFSLMGTSASFLGSFIMKNRGVLSTVSGSLIMVFGLFTMDVIKIPFLQRQKPLNLQTKDRGVAYVFLLGCAFALGWTPCIGPMLASILAYAASSGQTTKGISLLLVYSAGLGIPFIAVGIFFAKWRPLSSVARKFHPFYKHIVGGMMVIAGFLISFDLLFYLNIYGQRIFDFFGIDFWRQI